VYIINPKDYIVKTHNITTEKVLNMTTKFSKAEYKFAGLLKTMTVRQAATEMGITSKHAYQLLFRMRNKIEKAQNTVNVAANWMKNKRLAKLLRRQEVLEKEDPQ